eukprot:SAG22_NODE_849_length_6858_cov_1.246190_3_plen_126_part_00
MILLTHFNYIIVVILLCLGLWAMLSKKNLIKKCIGMAIFQTAIIMFFISMGTKKGASIPILNYVHGQDMTQHVVQASLYDNPLTQILMLTAIVVGVATLGVALSLIQRVYSEHGSIEEEVLLNDE